jgi:enamine deaminase RidA (YjgF/YER057c/UK114 family)
MASANSSKESRRNNQIIPAAFLMIYGFLADSIVSRNLYRAAAKFTQRLEPRVGLQPHTLVEQLHSKVTDAASELLEVVFGKEKSPRRLVYGVASLPLGTPVEVE